MSAKKIVIVGGVAAGTKAAAKARRLDQEADITIIEKGRYISYAGCGLPYYISGVVKEKNDLMSTPIGVLRDPEFFKKVKNLKVLNRHEAMSIDRQKKEVEVKNLDDDSVFKIPYDKLILATGSYPFFPPITGIELDGVYCLQCIEDADIIKSELEVKKARDAVVIGGGLISLESTENLVEAGCRVTIVEVLPQIMNFLDEELALLVQQHLESKGVRVITGEKVVSVEGQDGRAKEVVTENYRLPADFVMVAAGVKPRVELASAAGLDIGATGAIGVDDHMATSDPDIYAVGDCVENHCLVCEGGSVTYTPLGSTANKHGRVAAINACGGNETFNGIVKTGILKAFEMNVGRTGLSEREAREQGFDVVTVITAGPDKAHFYPTAKPIIIKLVGDMKSGKLLGAQIVGPGAVDKRIDVVATALTFGAKVEDISNLDLAYAPPFSPVMDNIIDAANSLRNKMEGRYKGMGPTILEGELKQGEDIFLLDVRSPQEFDEVRIPGSTLVPLGALRSRVEDVPKDKKVVTFCKSSLRAYEASLILQHEGYENVWVLDGGIMAWPFEKEKGKG
jgi:NADPH-dependent 2,4-dienoyl-CoA reductase/sulfur reductase-like enzyme/rhodanese-related sulfurtransferase